MTLAQLRTDLLSHLSVDGDNFAGDAPVQGDLTRQINYGVREVGRALFIVKSGVALNTVANQVSYDLGPLRVVRVIYVHRTGVPFKGYNGRPGLYSYEEANGDFEGWQDGGSAGTPNAALQLGAKLYLMPKPSGAEALTMTAQVLPPPLVGNDDVPDLPEWTHEAIVYVAAVYAAQPTTTGEEAMVRLAQYSQKASQAIAEEGTRNREMYGIQGDDRSGPRRETEQ
jgi:hypothetical protein